MRLHLYMLQALIMAVFSIISGTAISVVIEYKTREATSKAIASLILDIPVDRLSDIQTN